MVSHAASPIVNDGKMMWNETVKANCSRDSSNAERSIVRSYRHKVEQAAREHEESLHRTLRYCPNVATNKQI